MKAVAKFYKVSLAEYLKNGTEEEYNSIILPKRATVGSAGYDFFLNKDLYLNPNETTVVSTGIRAEIENGYLLSIYPRSGLGFKYRLRLDNTVGIIDSDYFFAYNEGHIKVKITNCGDKPLFVEKGKGFCQGIFTEYFITVDDDANGERHGGFGSTDKK